MKFKKNSLDRESLRLISLGGFGSVSQNMFIYEYLGNRGREILLVDCGVGFSNDQKADNDLTYPKIDYLLPFKDKIKGLFLTHGHEDHIGALPLILPKIGLNIPIYASRLTAALAREKLAEFNIKAKINVVNTQQKVNLGPFTLDFVYVTHSIPDTLNVAIKTPIGTIFHASDFKFDWTPVTGKQAQVGKIASIGNQGVMCLVSDCLRSEKQGYTLSETMVEDSLDREMKDCRGKVLVTTMSSNVSRWQQAANVCLRYGRKIALAGRSIEKIFDVAGRLGYFKFPQNAVVDLKRAKRMPPNQVCIFVAGSQGQQSSTLTKVAANAHRMVKVAPGDKVIFSADSIPGNELSIHGIIDDLSRLGANVSYSDILDDLHVSGHASQPELSLMINLVRAKYLLPTGGAFRQMKQYSLIAQKIGYKEEQIILPEPKQVIEFLPGQKLKKETHVPR